LLWALVASAAVHTAFVAMPLVLPGHRPGAIADPGVAMQATLVATLDQRADTQTNPQLAVAAETSPIQFAPQDIAAPPLPLAAAVPHPPSAPPRLLGVDGSTDVRIDGALLVDRGRLGDLYSRQVGEFPVEVDFPARLNEKIRARYPAAALAEGREDSVAVWVVVDTQGAPEEIVVADGSEEFADAVVAAVRNARFLPAQNNLVPIRFPLALEFHFTIGRRAVAGATTVAQ
jgi:TonB family protein